MDRQARAGGWSLRHVPSKNKNQDTKRYAPYQESQRIRPADTLHSIRASSSMACANFAALCGPKTSMPSQCVPRDATECHRGQIYQLHDAESVILQLGSRAIPKGLTTKMRAARSSLYSFPGPPLACLSPDAPQDIVVSKMRLKLGTGNGLCLLGRGYSLELRLVTFLCRCTEERPCLNK
jgi:hypothetical protein